VGFSVRTSTRARHENLASACGGTACFVADPDRGCVAMFFQEALTIADNSNTTPK
jgi:hypothetical protein